MLQVTFILKMKVIFIVILAVILAIALFTSASVSVIKLFAQTQQLLPTPCVSPQGIDICSKTTTSPLGLLVPSHGNISQAGNFSSATPLPPTSTNINTTDNLGKGGHATSCINNCTTSTSPTSSCSTKTGSCSQLQQQQHTAAYLQALNSGLPNPYKLGTKDYEHYQAGLDARRLNTGAVAGIATLSGTNGNSNNPHSTSKKCPDGSIIPTKDKCTTTSKQTNSILDKV